MEEVDLSTMSDAQKKAHMRRMKILQRSGERMAVASGELTVSYESREGYEARTLYIVHGILVPCAALDSDAVCSKAV